MTAVKLVLVRINPI